MMSFIIYLMRRYFSVYVITRSSFLSKISFIPKMYVFTIDFVAAFPFIAIDMTLMYPHLKEIIQSHSLSN